MSDQGSSKPETENGESASSPLKEAFASFDAEHREKAAQAANAAPAAASEDTAATAEPATPTDEKDARIVQLESEIAALNDQVLRAAADVQNARKRAERDRKDAETYGGVKLARDVLAVYDNLQQALNHASPELQEKEPGFFNGVSLTLKELLNAFAKHKITPIAPEPGERFDPNLHQAMYEQPHAEIEPGCVVNTMQAGFMIADRLLRPAMVGVAKPPIEGAPSPSETAAE